MDELLSFLKDNGTQLKQQLMDGRYKPNPVRRAEIPKETKGWVNYFGMADMKALLTEIDEWLRHKIRAIYWKQWKKTKTRYKRLRALGIEEEQVHRHANNRHGVWFCSGLQYFNCALDNTKLLELGFPTFTEFYLKICEN